MCAARILFKLSGSIAAWKACGVISRLVQDGHEVQTVATASSLRFVGAATLEGLTGRAVRSDIWEAGAAMEHINLTKWADLTILCPATANTINRLAAGLADDLVGALFLAHARRKPYLVAPAMNPAMWAHPATIAGVEKLRSWGVRVLPVAAGRLACGDEGEGRLLEPEAILAAVRDALAEDAPQPARRLRVLITSGGTEEPIDGVRSIGNFSTGRTGAILADAFAGRGHEVLLLRAKRAVAASEKTVRTRTYASFADLEAALRESLAAGHFDAVIHAAAVSDYSVATVSVDGVAHPPGAGGKLDSGHDVAIALRPNPKLIDHLREWSANPAVRVVGFKLTRGADTAAVKTAVDTLAAHAKPDLIVHNDLSTLDESGGRFPATILRPCAPGAENVQVQTRDELAAVLEDLLVGGVA